MEESSLGSGSELHLEVGLSGRHVINRHRLLFWVQGDRRFFKALSFFLTLHSTLACSQLKAASSAFSCVLFTHTPHMLLTRASQTRLTHVSHASHTHLQHLTHDSHTCLTCLTLASHTHHTRLTHIPHRPHTHASHMSHMPYTSLTHTHKHHTRLTHTTSHASHMPHTQASH